MITLVPKDSLAGIIVGPILWSIYFVLSYIVSGLVCSLGYSETTVAGMNPVQLVLLLVGLLIALFIVAAGMQAHRGRRQLRSLIAENEAEESALQRHDFLYLASLLLCGFSLIGVIWLGMAAAIAPIC